MAADKSPIGTTLAGRFRIQRAIGKGGMATVYAAKQDADPEDVAIKLMKRELMKEKTVLRRFQREAKAAARLVHPNTIRVIDYGVDGDDAYIAMELAKGKDLLQALAQQRPMAQVRAVRIVAQVCGALEAAHGEGIIHRDLKPENIMLVDDPEEPDGELVKVLDFGIAKILERPDTGKANKSDDPSTITKSALTRAGTIVGTPAYMSPEQCRGGDLDGRSDVYACGVLLYQLVTGQVPFLGETPLHTAMRHIHAAPRPLRELRPGVHEKLEAAVLKALAKWPAERQQSARELLEELRAVLEVLPGGGSEMARKTGRSASDEPQSTTGSSSDADDLDQKETNPKGEAPPDSDDGPSTGYQPTMHAVAAVGAPLRARLGYAPLSGSMPQARLGHVEPDPSKPTSSRSKAPSSNGQHGTGNGAAANERERPERKPADTRPTRQSRSNEENKPPSPAPDAYDDDDDDARTFIKSPDSVDELRPMSPGGANVAPKAGRASDSGVTEVAPMNTAETPTDTRLQPGDAGSSPQPKAASVATSTSSSGASRPTPRGRADLGYARTQPGHGLGPRATTRGVGPSASASSSAPAAAGLGTPGRRPPGVMTTAVMEPEDPIIREAPAADDDDDEQPTALRAPSVLEEIAERMARDRAAGPGPIRPPDSGAPYNEPTGVDSASPTGRPGGIRTTVRMGQENNGGEAPGPSSVAETHRRPSPSAEALDPGNITGGHAIAQEPSIDPGVISNPAMAAPAPAPEPTKPRAGPTLVSGKNPVAPGPASEAVTQTRKRPFGRILDELPGTTGVLLGVGIGVFASVIFAIIAAVLIR